MTQVLAAQSELRPGTHRGNAGPSARRRPRSAGSGETDACSRISVFCGPAVFAGRTWFYFQINNFIFAGRHRHSALLKLRGDVRSHRHRPAHSGRGSRHVREGRRGARWSVSGFPDASGSRASRSVLRGRGMPEGRPVPARSSPRGPTALCARVPF